MIKERINSVVGKVDNAIFALEKHFIYKTLTDLRFTMRKYVVLVCDNDLNAIKRYNVPIRNKVLANAYNELMHEYAVLSDNKEVINAKEQRSILESLVRKQNILVSCIMVLKVMPDDEKTIAFLHRSGIRGTNILERLENEIKMINIRIEEQKSMAKVNDKTSTEKATLSDYMRIFAVLGKNGYKASIDMPVLEFIQTMSLYRKEAEENAKQLEKIKNKR